MGTYGRNARSPQVRPPPEVFDGNGKPLSTTDTVKVPFWLRHILALLEFLVVENVANFVIIGRDYFARFVKAVSACGKFVEQDDGTAVPIFPRPLKYATNGPNLPLSWEPEENVGRKSPTVKAENCSYYCVGPSVGYGNDETP